MRLFAAAAALVALLLGAAPARAELFVDFGLGKSFTDDSDISIRQPGLGNRFVLHDVGFAGESLSGWPPWYTLRGGYFPMESVGVALELVHLKILAETDRTTRLTGTRDGAPVDTRVRIDSVVQTYDITHGVNYLLGEVIVRGALIRDEESRVRLSIYTTAGLGPVITHAENRVGGVANRESYDLAGYGLAAALGVELLPLPLVGVLIEYKATRAELDVAIASGESRVVERSRHLALGVSVHLH